jgi:uncharacterized protein YegL
MFRTFIREAAGSVLPTFAIAAIPLIVSTGAVVDYSNAYDQKMIVQDSMDSAALAAGKKIGLLSLTEVEAEAGKFFVANIGDKITNPPTLNTLVAASTITLTSELHVPTYFLGMIGLDEFVFPLISKATLALGTLEVVMALDNSGSMSGTKITTLRTAAANLTTTLFNLGTTSTKPDPIKVGLVPFAAAVNVGSGYANATWMDGTAVGSYHGESFEPLPSSPPVNVFTLFDGINNVSWGGCVEERPMPYDISDDPPNPGNPPTMIVPMFAPDEPDNLTCTTSSCSYAGWGSARRFNGATSGSKSYNNYLADYPGQCGSSNNNQWTCANGNANCNGSNSGVSEETAFERTCKYGTASNKVTPSSTTIGGIDGGPNFMCSSNPLTPLTTNQTAITAAINAMPAEGATNITAGLTWAWRLLSPGVPFTEGRSYSVGDNQKILILMTDGANTYYPNSSFLKSWYGAWGYVREGHLGTTSTNQDTLQAKMDERTAAACTNAKAAGVKVYTVAFQVTDTPTLNMLTACATEPDMAFQSSSTSALLAAFTAIGDDITLLRIAQ